MVCISSGEEKNLILNGKDVLKIYGLQEVPMSTQQQSSQFTVLITLAIILLLTFFVVIILHLQLK
jgi:hypothetical protein